MSTRISPAEASAERVEHRSMERGALHSMRMAGRYAADGLDDLETSDHMVLVYEADAYLSMR